MSVHRAGSDEELRLQSFLRSSPGENAFQLGWLHECGVLPSWPGQQFEYLLATGADGRLAGSALFAGAFHGTLAAGEPAAYEAIARWTLEQPRGLRSLTGPSESVRGFLASYPPTVRVASVAQVLMSLGSRELRYFAEPGLVRAVEHDQADVESAAARMYAEEMGHLLRHGDQDLVRRSAGSRVLGGRTWIVRCPATNRLVFKASVASYCPEVAQVEGVWVEPAWRGAGLARRALSEMCRELLTHTDRISLYVAADNAPALGLYRRLGFREERAWETCLLG